MDKDYLNLFNSIVSSKADKGNLWPLFHKALHRCRIYDHAGNEIDRCWFFWTTPNMMLKSVLAGQSANIIIKELSRQEFNARWQGV